MNSEVNTLQNFSLPWWQDYGSCTVFNARRITRILKPIFLNPHDQCWRETTPNNHYLVTLTPPHSHRRRKRTDTANDLNGRVDNPAAFFSLVPRAISHCRWKPETDPKWSYDLEGKRDFMKTSQAVLEYFKQDMLLASSTKLYKKGVSSECKIRSLYKKNKYNIIFDKKKSGDVTGKIIPNNITWCNHFKENYVKFSFGLTIFIRIYIL